MKRFKSIFLGTLLFFVIPFTFAYGADPIYIGLMAPMTGDYAEYGMFFKEGIGLAVDEINKAGGIKGQQVELLVGDSRADPKEAALVAQKFVANPKDHGGDRRFHELLRHGGRAHLRRREDGGIFPVLFPSGIHQVGQVHVPEHPHPGTRGALPCPMVDQGSRKEKSGHDLH